MRVGQSRMGSLLESLLNILIGYGVALLAQALIFPLFGLAVSFTENMMIGGLFTIVSIIRSYWVRRLFNYLHLNQYLK